MRRTARFFKAISDQTRLRILCLLFRNGQASAQEIEQVLGIPQDRASGHLKYLLNAGVVVNRDQGREVGYRVMTQTDPFRRSILEGLRSRLSEPEISGGLNGLPND